jgi:hypothetical protein
MLEFGMILTMSSLKYVGRSERQVDKETVGVMLE